VKPKPKPVFESKASSSVKNLDSILFSLDKYKKEMVCVKFWSAPSTQRRGDLLLPLTYPCHGSLRLCRSLIRRRKPKLTSRALRRQSSPTRPCGASMSRKRQPPMYAAPHPYAALLVWFACLYVNGSLCSCCAQYRAHFVYPWV
jgi:hypothetical protein